MLEQSVRGFLSTYFFDDAMIQQVSLYLDRGEVELDMSAPILPAHPGYSQARVDANYRKGRIYSPEDWRDLKICLRDVKNCEAKLNSTRLADQQIHRMPYEFEIDEFKLILLPTSVASLSLQAESLSLSCRFQILEYTDSPMKTV
jgi:hypothetical protein